MTVQARRDVFQAIADPTRRAIINLVAHQSLNQGGIAEHFDMSRPAISQHMKILIDCGIVVMKQRGRERYCEAQLSKLAEIEDWLAPFRAMWEHRFDKVDNILEQMKGEEHSKTPKK